MINQNFDEALTKQKEKKSGWSCIYTIMKWILTLSIWGNMVWLIIITNKDKNTDLLIPFLLMTISYILYVIFEFFSPTLSLLRSKITNKGYEEVISDFVQAAPDINFTSLDEIYNGHKIDSHKFHYKFCMDYSKKSIYNLKEKKGKYFVKIIINREIYSNDNETSDAFSEKEKEFSQEINSGKRWVDISFPGLKNTCLITNGNKCIFSSCLVYIIFIFLSFGEIYELILKCKFVEKTITIKKMITVQNEFKFPVIKANEIATQNISEKNSNENEVILQNYGSKLTLKNSTTTKFIFRNITLENNQNENETNRNAERDNPSLNSTINIPYRGN